MPASRREDQDISLGTQDCLQAAHQFLVGQLAAFQILFQQGVLAFGRRFDQFHAGFLGSRFEVGGDLFGGLALVGIGFHRDQVDHAFEGGFFTPGQLHRHQAGGGIFLDGGQWPCGNRRCHGPTC